MKKLRLNLMTSGILLCLMGSITQAGDQPPLDSAKAKAIMAIRLEFDQWKEAAHQDLKSKESLASYLLPLFQKTFENLNVAINSSLYAGVPLLLSKLEIIQATDPMNSAKSSRLKTFNPLDLRSATRELKAIKGVVDAGDFQLSSSDRLGPVLDGFQTRLLRAAKSAIGMTEFERAPENAQPKDFDLKVFDLPKPREGQTPANPILTEINTTERIPLVPGN